ncbi:hypothetical protein CRUP_002391 [Coryphaenoides rupestris]|nr:hypothetical protein CRUP_002391 [Coryphaenoides rupestris]
MVEHFQYPDDATAYKKKKIRFDEIRERPETLFSDKPDAKGIYLYMILYTDNTVAWHRALQEVEDVSYSTSSNGTVLIHRFGSKEKDKLFGEIFGDIKARAQKYVKLGELMLESESVLADAMSKINLGEQRPAGRDKKEDEEEEVELEPLQ